MTVVTADVSWVVGRPPEVLPGEGFRLVRPHRDDAPELAAAVQASLPALQPWMPWATPDYGVEAAREFIQTADEGWAEGAAFAWLVIQPGPDGRPELVGTNGLMARIGPGRLEIGYWIRSDRTGQRLARRSTEVVLAAARRALPEVEAFVIKHEEPNLASRSVPVALGFTHVATEQVEPVSARASGRLQVWSLPA